MRFSTVKRLWFSVDLFDAELDENGSIKQETYRGRTRVSLDTGDLNALSIDSESPLLSGTVLRNIKDRFGELIFPSVNNTTGNAYVIYHEEPILSPFGTREGFTSKANRVG